MSIDIYIIVLSGEIHHFCSPSLERKHFSCFAVYSIHWLIYTVWKRLHLENCVRHTLYSHINTAHAISLRATRKPPQSKTEAQFSSFFSAIISAMFFQTKTLVCLGNSSESVTVRWAFRTKLVCRNNRVPLYDIYIHRDKPFYYINTRELEFISI